MELSETSSRLVKILRMLGEDYGALGVANAAAKLANINIDEEVIRADERSQTIREALSTRERELIHLRAKVKVLSYLHRRADDTYWVRRDDVLALLGENNDPSN